MWTKPGLKAGLDMTCTDGCLIIVAINNALSSQYTVGRKLITEHMDLTQSINKVICKQKQNAVPVLTLWIMHVRVWYKYWRLMDRQYALRRWAPKRRCQTTSADDDSTCARRSRLTFSTHTPRHASPCSAQALTASDFQTVILTSAWHLVT